MRFSTPGQRLTTRKQLAHPPKHIPESIIDIIKAKLWARQINKAVLINMDERTSEDNDS